VTAEFVDLWLDDVDDLRCVLVIVGLVRLDAILLALIVALEAAGGLGGLEGGELLVDSVTHRLLPCGFPSEELGPIERFRPKRRDEHRSSRPGGSKRPDLGIRQE
jgi:hypothetical protein